MSYMFFIVWFNFDSIALVLPTLVRLNVAGFRDPKDKGVPS